MANPKFSIVIRTRERPETPKYTLKTCLTQEFDDYEIVVADNCSSASTKDVVNAFGFRASVIGFDILQTESSAFGRAAAGQSV